MLFGIISNGSSTKALRGWTARNGNDLLVNIADIPPSDAPNCRPFCTAEFAPKPRLSVVGPPDYKLLKHRASGFAADHPINRNYN